MRSSRWLIAGLFVASTVVVVSAQQPGGRQGGGGRGLTSQVATNVALQEELKVTEDQKAKLKAGAEKLAAGGKERFQETGGDKEKVAALFAKIAEENAKAVNEVLTAEQKTRLKQLDRQVSPVRAFTNDELVAELKLEDGQKTKIKGIAEEYAKDTRELGGFGGFGKGGFDKEKAAESAKKREKLEKGALADIDEVLNDNQRKTWKDLTGPAAADIAKIRAGAFGGFGAGGKGKTTPKKD